MPLQNDSAHPKVPIQNFTKPMKWDQWKTLNADKLKHPAGFEERFVSTVLSKITGLDPEDVIPQYAFVDNEGKNRRIDFMILNSAKGYMLPIELDGASKDETRAHWNDFLERQNSIVRSFGVILRFANVKMFNNPTAIIDEVGEQLATQAAAKHAANQRLEILHPTRGGHATLPPTIPEPAEPVTPDAVSAGVTPHRNKFTPPRWNPTLLAAGFVCITAALAVYWALGGLGSLADAEPSVERASPSAVKQRTAEQFSYVATADAIHYVGNERLVCGSMAHQREISAGLFLNFDQPFPEHSFSAVIWRRNIGSVTPPNIQAGTFVCIFGTIDEFRNKPQIEITRNDQIRY